MKLRYEISIEDCVAFGHHLVRNSQTMRRAMRSGQMLWAACPIGGVLFVILYNKAPFYKALVLIALIGIIVSVPFYFLYPLYFRWQHERYIRKINKEGKNRGVLGEHELSIEEDGIIEKTDVNENKLLWESVEHIASTENHTFIYISPIMAHVIPRLSVISGNYDDFVTELKKRYPAE